jgi:hypothetical protein
MEGTAMVLRVEQTAPDLELLREQAWIVRSAVPRESCQRITDELLKINESEPVRYAYFETLKSGSIALCRVERFTEWSVIARPLVEVARDVLLRHTSPVSLMKEKINISWPGGGSYHCHQDAQAYPFPWGTIFTVGVALTRSTVSNGCLWVSTGIDRLLPDDDTGFVTPEAAADCTFTAAELETGDAVVFSGTVPHYSEANQGGSPRILALITFALAKERQAGERRRRYYQWFDQYAVSRAPGLGDPLVQVSSPGQK